MPAELAVSAPASAFASPEPDLDRAAIPPAPETLPDAEAVLARSDSAEEDYSARLLAAAGPDAKPEAHPSVLATPIEDASFAAPQLAAANDETPTLYDLDALAENADGALGPEAHDDSLADDDDILTLDNVLQHALVTTTVEPEIPEDDDILDLDRIVEAAQETHRTAAAELLDPQSVAIPEPPARRG
jgi:hypothetical protein